MQEESYMVCVRVDEVEDPIEGSTTTACVECGSDIWISIESRKKMGQIGAMPLCVTCAKRLAQELGQPEIGLPSEGQMEEIINAALEEHPEWKSVFDQKMDSFDAFKATAHMVFELMTEPNDDLGSMLVVEDWDGHTYPPVPISDFLAAGMPKDVLAKQVIPAMVQAAQAKRVIIGLSSWTVSGKGPEDLDCAVSEHPDREERMVVMDITADGVQQLSFAAITRDGVSKPSLGEWHDSEKPTGSKGLFVEALVPTLQLVKTLRGE